MLRAVLIYCLVVLSAAMLVPGAVRHHGVHNPIAASRTHAAMGLEDSLQDMIDGVSRFFATVNSKPAQPPVRRPSAPQMAHVSLNAATYTLRLTPTDCGRD